MTSANNKSFARKIIEEKIKDLREVSVELANDNGVLIVDIENMGKEIEESREQIRALERYIEDRVEMIKFSSVRIENNNRNIEDTNSAVADLEKDLNTLTPIKSTTKPKAPRVRTQYGELTPEQMKVIRKKYAVLLELRGASLYEYLEFLKSKGHTETNKAISLSLGKNGYWYSNMSALARKAGYDA